MDPRLFDLIWEAYRTSGSNDYIHVVCGYRSPQTNSMLRSRSKGVAKKSQHMLGKAMDFYIPGVKLKRLREIGLKMQGGGVGYYPSLRIALRAFRRRQCPPLAQDEPQRADRAVPRRQDAACAVGRQAASRLQSGARLLPGAQEERQCGDRQPRQSFQARRARAACLPLSSAAAVAPTTRKTAARVNVAVERRRGRGRAGSRSRRPSEGDGQGRHQECRQQDSHPAA